MTIIGDGLDLTALVEWMGKRHDIYLARASGQKPPWTDDPILSEYRFCNVFRELDTVTIWIDENIRRPYADNPNLWLMLAIARTINHPDTLRELMENAVWPIEKYDGRAVASVLNERKNRGEQVYTGAYMIRAESDPNAEWYSWTKQEYIAQIVLGRLWTERRGILDLFHGLGQPSLRKVWEWFLSFHGWGPFMSYEVVTDMRHTRYLREAPDIMTWANAGPGALRGLNRLLGRDKDAAMTKDAATFFMYKILCHLNDNPSLAPNLPRPLEMRDIEHSLCEVDKYLRVLNGEGRPRAKYRAPLG